MNRRYNNTLLVSYLPLLSKPRATVPRKAKREHLFCEFAPPTQFHPMVQIGIITPSQTEDIWGRLSNLPIHGTS